MAAYNTRLRSRLASEPNLELLNSTFREEEDELLEVKFRSIGTQTPNMAVETINIDLPPILCTPKRSSIHALDCSSPTWWKQDLKEKMNKISCLELELTQLKMKLEHLTTHQKEYLSIKMDDFEINGVGREIFSLCNSQKHVEQCAFVDPLLVHILKNGLPSAYHHLSSANVLNGKNYVCMIVNDAKSNDEGTHWSLIIFNVITNDCYYLDSLSSLNLNHAENVNNEFSKYLNKNISFNLLDIDCPQQNGTNDCGLYALAYIWNFLENNCQFDFADFGTYLEKTSHLVQNFRLKRRLASRSLINETLIVNASESCNNSKQTKKTTISHTNELNLPAICNNTKKIEIVKKGMLRKRVLLLADSHGRDLSTHLQILLGISFKVTSIVHPGCKLSNVVNNIKDLCENYTYSDYVIILGGTNDVWGFSPFQLSILSALQGMSCILNKTNIIFAAIPPRFDQPKLNSQINMANYISFEYFCNRSPSNFVWLNWHGIDRSYFTSHGLHMNKKFKTLLSEFLCTVICDSSSFQNNLVIRSLESIYEIQQQMKMDPYMNDIDPNDSLVTIDDTTPPPFLQPCLYELTI